MPNSNHPEIADARHAMAARLEVDRTQIIGRLKRWWPITEQLTVLPYYTDALEMPMIPVLMLEQQGDTVTWEAMPEVAQHEFRIQLWGVIAGYPLDVIDNLLSALAAAVRSCLNQQHTAFEFEGRQFFFNETAPVPSVSYGVYKFQTSTVRCFTAQVVVHTHYQLNPKGNEAE